MTYYRLTNHLLKLPLNAVHKHHHFTGIFSSKWYLAAVDYSKTGTY